MTSIAQRIVTFIDASPGWSAGMLTIAAAASAVIAPSPPLDAATLPGRPMLIGTAPVGKVVVLTPLAHGRRDGSTSSGTSIA
jgi:hypothetical protein